MSLITAKNKKTLATGRVLQFPANKARRVLPIPRTAVNKSISSFTVGVIGFESERIYEGDTLICERNFDKKDADGCLFMFRYRSEDAHIGRICFLARNRAAIFFTYETGAPVIVKQDEIEIIGKIVSVVREVD